MLNELALDISQFSGEVSTEQFALAKSKGVRKVVVALNNLPLAVRQANNAKAAGLEVEAYIYYYFAQDVITRTNAALGAIKDLNIQRIWIDCEDTKHTLSPAALTSKIAAIRDRVLALGYSPGIYSANWWWSTNMAGVTTFKDLPLWDAYWDDNPDIDTPRYGGWAAAEMSQYQADTMFAGIWCDLNSYTTTALPPRLKVTDTTINRIVQAISATNGANHKPLRYNSAGLAVYEFTLP